MIRGFYSATSGMLTANRKIDVGANNIANVSTAGFKSDKLTATVFEETVTSRIEKNNSAAVGTLSNRTVAGQILTNMTQGSINETGSPLNIAISGEGFFTFQSTDGQTWFSRSGQFTVDAEGYLALPQGGRLMGEKGAIQVGGSNFTVNRSGEVFDAKGEMIDKLLIYLPAGDTMVKQDEGMYMDLNFNQANYTDTASLLQGSLETSNVDMTRELTDMIASQRSFQACSQALKMIDSTLQKAVNEVGRT